MKETQQIQPNQQEVRKADQQKGKKLAGRIILKKGLKLYSYNYRTKEFKEVEIDRQRNVSYSGEAMSNAKAQYEEHTMYVQALNEKNALRKLNKRLDKMLEILDGEQE